MRLDLVIPAHNEEHRIDRTLHAYRSSFTDLDVRLLVALDSCTDRTAEIVEEHRTHDERVHTLDYPKLGKGGVIMETLRRCDADLVGFVDADCATPPAELGRLVEASLHVDGAIASRRHPASVIPGQRRPARQVTAAGFAFGGAGSSACRSPTRNAARRCCAGRWRTRASRTCRRATSSSTSICS